MKLLHRVLTVLVIISLIVGLIGFVNMFGELPSGHPISVLAMTLGTLLGSFAVPALLFAARQYVGKKLKQQEKSGS